MLILISLLIAPLLWRHLLLMLLLLMMPIVDVLLCLLLGMLLCHRRRLLCLLLLLILKLHLPLAFLSLSLYFQLLLLLLGLLLQLLLPAVPLAGPNFFQRKLHGWFSGVQIRVDVPFRITADTVRVVRFFQTEWDVPPLVVGAGFTGESKREADAGWFRIDGFFLFRG